MKKIVVALLILTLCITICSCTMIDDAQKEVKKVETFITSAVEISSISDPELALEKAEDLIHPDSGLDVEAIVNQVLESESVKALNAEEYGIYNYQIGEFGTPNLSFGDETLGGNVYELTAVVTIIQIIDGKEVATPLNVDVRLLSTDWGIGLYDFTID